MKKTLRSRGSTTVTGDLKFEIPNFKEDRDRIAIGKRIRLGSIRKLGGGNLTRAETLGGCGAAA
jgi:hypothetical protein